MQTNIWIQRHVDIGLSDDINRIPKHMAKEEDLPGFCKWMTEGYNLLQRNSLKILEAMKLGLGFRPGTFAARCEPEAREFRSPPGAPSKMVFNIGEPTMSSMMVFTMSLCHGLSSLAAPMG